MDTDINAPIVIEVPDERLAEVEKAKMTGEALVSVGSKGNQIATRGMVAKAVQDAMDIGNSPQNRMPDYLTELSNGVEDVMELNQKKAKAHSDVSAEIVRKQQEEVAARHLSREESFELAKQNNDLNRRLAAEYSANMAEWERARQEADGLRSKELRLITEEEAFSGFAITELGKRNKAVKADILERPTFEEKDAIVYGAAEFGAKAKHEYEPEPEAEAQIEYSEQKPLKNPQTQGRKAPAKEAEAPKEAPKEG